MKKPEARAEWAVLANTCSKRVGALCALTPATLPNSLEVMDVSGAVVKYLRENLNGTVTAAITVST